MSTVDGPVAANLAAEGDVLRSRLRLVEHRHLVAIALLFVLDIVAMLAFKLRGEFDKAVSQFEKAEPLLPAASPQAQDARAAIAVATPRRWKR